MAEPDKRADAARAMRCSVLRAAPGRIFPLLLFLRLVLRLLGSRVERVQRVPRGLSYGFGRAEAGHRGGREGVARLLRGAEAAEHLAGDLPRRLVLLRRERALIGEQTERDLLHALRHE